MTRIPPAPPEVYEPLVVNGAFKVFGGNLHERVAKQGRAAVAAARGRPILDLPVGTATFTIPIAREHSGVVVGADIAAQKPRPSPYLPPPHPPPPCPPPSPSPPTSASATPTSPR